MTTYTPVLGAQELALSQAIPETTVNEIVLLLEQGAMAFAVKDKDLAAPPGSPAAGDAYIVAAAPTGAWSGKAANIAFWQAGTGWRFVVPREGFRADVADEDVAYRYDGAAWALVTAGGLTGYTIDIDGSLAANSDTNIATQKAVKTYVDTAVTGLLDLKGNIDCSANPNYPAALKGDVYMVSVAGKVGGASGTSVDVGDVVIAKADNAGGTEASVGSSWFSIEHNGIYGTSAVEAADSDIWTGTDTSKVITPRRLVSAAVSQALTDGATITPDFNTGFNFHVTLGGNRTLANPTNAKAGQSGRIRIKQDATGSRTLAFGSNWLFPGGDPILSTAANAIDVIAFYCHSSTEIEASCIKALA